MQNEESAAPAETPARPRFRLKLDHDDVYFGCEKLAAGEEAAAGDIVLDHAPDNAPGLYRWLYPEARLEPLPKTKQKAAPDAPTLEQAFYELVHAVIPSGSPLPSRIAAWCAWFEKSFDAKS
jgi:hypothetical protein